MTSTPSPNFVQPLYRHHSSGTHGGHFESHCSMLLPANPAGHSSSSSSASAPSRLTPGQASLLQALFSLSDPVARSRDSLVSDLFHGPSISYASTMPFVRQVYDGDDGESVEGGDMKYASQSMRTNPTLDPNTVDNTLPFLLASFAQRINSNCFDAPPIMRPCLEIIIKRFKSSPKERERVTLVANVLSTLSERPRRNELSMAIATLLKGDAYNSITHFYSISHNPHHEVDMFNALKTVNSVMEVIMIWRFSGQISTVIKLMEAIAPVFRRACPEPPDRLVNLPNLLLGQLFHPGQFAITDVIHCVTTGRPMFYRYDTSYTPKMGYLFDQGYGMQRLHGVPDRFMVMLALINAHYEDFGTSLRREDITEIENRIRAVESIPSPSPSSILTVRRLSIQECWRQALCVYLFMLLCGAGADDVRVVKAVRVFMQLLDGAKPACSLDTFLIIPMAIVGVAALRKSHRQMLYQRMLAIQDRTNFGVSAGDCLFQLANIWARAEAEQRVAVWSDMRIACYCVSGV